MPGLTGFVDFNHSSEQKGFILQNMVQSMKHEEWYKADSYVNREVALSRIHLGGFNAESQPIFNKNKSICIFFYGEIYDYENLKSDLQSKGHIFRVNNDAEFLLHLFEEKGQGFVDNLNGSFVCAIWDMQHERLVIANDRYGLRPLYYTEHANQFIFASEVKPIIDFPGFKKKVNLRAIPDLLAFGSMLGDNTLFEGVLLMESGSIMIYEQGSLTIKKYWDFEYKEDYPKKSLTDYCEEFNHLFRQAIRRQSSGNNKIGVPLSGGLDSRLVAAYLWKEGYSFSTHTYGVKGCYDYKFAKKVARVLGADHHFYETDGEYIPNYYRESLKLTNGLLDICNTQQIILPKRINNVCDVLYIGFAADLIFGGGYVCDNILNLTDEKKLPSIVYDSFSWFFKSWMQKDFFNKSTYEEIKNASIDKIVFRLSQTKADIPINKADYVYLNERVRRFTINANLILLNQKLEYRTPTYDNDLVDFALTLPPRLRLNSLLYKELLKRYFPKLARIPWQKDGFPLTASYARRRIQKSMRYRLNHSFNGKFARYVSNTEWHDLDNWTRTVNKDFFINILLDKKTLDRPYFNQGYIKEHFIEPHMSGKAIPWTAISILTTFELWHRYFLDE